VYQRYGLERGDICKVVGIADAMEYRRKNIAAAHHIDDAHVFQDFHDLTQVVRCDAMRCDAMRCDAATLGYSRVLPGAVL